VVERYRTRFLFVEIPSRVYQSLRRAVRRRCNLYGAVRDTPAPDWPWPWRRAANHGRGDGGVQSARATAAGGQDVYDYAEGRERNGEFEPERDLERKREQEEASPSPQESGGGPAGGRNRSLSLTHSLSLSFCCLCRRHRRHRRAPVVFGRSTIFRWSDANDIPRTDDTRARTHPRTRTHAHIVSYRIIHTAARPYTVYTYAAATTALRPLL